MSEIINSHPSTLSLDYLHGIGPVAQVFGLQQSAERAQEEREEIASEVWKHLANHPANVAARKRAQETQLHASQAQEEIGGVVFCVAKDNLEEVNKRLAVLNRRAARINSEPISLKVTNERVLLNYDYAQDDNHVYRATFEHIFVILSGTTPRIPGFEFLAKVTHTEAGNIISRIPALRYSISHNVSESQAKQAVESIDLAKYRATSNLCEHCHTIRPRIDTYVVYNEATGETKQVGRNCLADFTGANDPEKILKLLEAVWEYMRSLNSKGQTPSILTKDYLTHVACMIRESGWTPRNGGWGTADDALTNMRNRISQVKTRQGEPAWIEPTDADSDRAEQIIQWGQTLDMEDAYNGNNDFLYNVIVVVKNEVMPVKKEGIAAAAYIAHDRYLSRKLEAERVAASPKDHVGTIGKRETFSLTLKAIRWIEDHYNGGEKPLYLMADQQGNEVKWFASRAVEMSEGETYEVLATVKSHDDSERFGKCTRITRATIKD